MADNGRSELSKATLHSNLAGNYPNGQNGSAGPSLDRRGSFRESKDGRIVGSRKGASQGSGTSTGDMPPLSQSLMLEPIVIGNQKSTRSGELRKALGFPVGCSSVDNSFGASHLKASPPATTEELKRFRAGVANTCIKASGRAKNLDEHLHKLNKYFEAMTTRKLQRNDLLSNERSAPSNLKMGTDIYRSPSGLVSPNFEDRPKNVMLKKRVRSSVAETRAGLRNNGLPRQPLVTKDHDMLKDTNADPGVAHQKIRGLPVEGESWDRKMKRKRSVGAVYSSQCGSDTELKRNIHHKLTGEPALQSCGSQSMRYGTSSGAGAMKKSGGASPAGSNARASFKNEPEKSSFSKDTAPGLIKERLLPKASVKLNIREENHSICQSLVAKGKASRTPRSGSTTTTNTISSIPSVCGTLESWDPAPSAKKNQAVGSLNNRKRPKPSESSSPPITQWVGQRPQKISRTRRTNIVSPVSNYIEQQLSSEGCSPSDFGARFTTNGTNGPRLSKSETVGPRINNTTSGVNGSPLSKNETNGTETNKGIPERASLPSRVSESGESSAGESRFKEKGPGNNGEEEKPINHVQTVGPTILVKKNKFSVKGESGDGVRRQGRSARVTSVSRTSISPLTEKVDNAAVRKPLQSIRHSSDKSGSKLGRPLKKLIDRKGCSRFGLAGGNSSDFTGESEDDFKELISAANLAYKSNFLACSSTFWKKVEVLFGPLNSEEKSYLLEQVPTKGDHMLGEICFSESVSSERKIHKQNVLARKDLVTKVELVDQFQSSIFLTGAESGGISDKISPLYQRVLSALIIEDDIEELEENRVGNSMSDQNTPWNSFDETCYHVDTQRNFRDSLECACVSAVGVGVRKSDTGSRCLSCIGYSNAPDPSCNGELLKVNTRDVHSNVEALVGLTPSDSGGPQSSLESSGGFSSYDCQYEKMRFEDKLLLELQSVGLYSETVPDLHGKEHEVINREIIQLQEELYRQTNRKKMRLDKIQKVIQEGQDTDGRNLEHAAMNRLVELAYKKLLATRRSLAIKNGIPKVSKQVALAFAKRTLIRCRKFEEFGLSCFDDPALRDIISAVPPHIYEADPLTSTIVTVANGSAGSGDRNPSSLFERISCQEDKGFSKNGRLSNRGKKNELLLDDVGHAAFRSSLGSSHLGGSKGKRTERDSDISIRNGVAKAGCSVSNSKGELRMKMKHKERTTPLSTSGSGCVSQSTETAHLTNPLTNGSVELISNNGNRKREVVSTSGNVHPDPLKDTKEPVDFANVSINDMDTIDELGVGSELAGPQDLNNWFNFDVDGLQDHDSIGLEIPMDDLSELNMF